MADIVTIGLVQAHHDTDGAEPVEKHKRVAIEKHVELIRDAARRGAQIVCLQELFYGPYFCTEQNPKWYEATELVPEGPTTRLMQGLARELGIALVVPLYERTISGVYYNTAVVIDADGSVLGIYRKHHIPQVAAGPAGCGFWEKYYFKPGNAGFLTFQTKFARIGVYICYDRHFPEGARLQPVGDRRRALGVPLEARTAGARRRQRLLRRCDQSRRLRDALEHG
jgi:beta-ureidopropionase